MLVLGDEHGCMLRREDFVGCLIVMGVVYVELIARRRHLDQAVKDRDIVGRAFAHFHVLAARQANVIACLLFHCHQYFLLWRPQVNPQGARRLDVVRLRLALMAGA